MAIAYRYCKLFRGHTADIFGSHASHWSEEEGRITHQLLEDLSSKNPILRYTSVAKAILEKFGLGLDNQVRIISQSFWLKSPGFRNEWHFEILHSSAMQLCQVVTPSRQNFPLP
jgi:hypothetical protein